jgi:anthranilate synthase/aminodeoxychorismate synthase-like glutamine amidotransferase
MQRTVRVLMIDNYDSFTFNLVQALRVLGAEVTVVRNDAVPASALPTFRPTHVVVSPGPGRPEDAGLSLAALETFCGRVPVLGVCLGHQAIARHYGGQVIGARRLMHGKVSNVRHDGLGLFEGSPRPLPVGRYHSLAVDASRLPTVLRPTAFDEDGEVMGLQHTSEPTVGVQFHPESVLTPDGPRLLERFLAMRVGA